MADWKERESDRYSHDKWYQNIWFHHKWKILITTLVIAIIGILFFSSNMTDPVDMYVLFITETPEIYKEKVTALSTVLAEYANDKNGDGEVSVFVENLYVGDEFDSANVYQNKEKIMTTLRSGDCMFLIADEVGAQYLIEAEACADITSKIPQDPDGTVEFEGKAWAWLGSDFKESNDMLKKAFGDTQLFFTLRVFEGTIAELTERSSKNFENAEDLLVSIITNTKAE